MEATPRGLRVSEITFRTKKPGQRACDVKNAKGKLCCGHLKRWYTYGEDLTQQVGKDAEIYRCERCRSLYQADPADDSTAGSRYDLRKVNLFGGFLRRQE